MNLKSCNKSLLALLVISIAWINAAAQQRGKYPTNVDSLQAEINKAENKNKKAGLLNAVTLALAGTNPDKGLANAILAIDLAKDLKDKNLLAEAFHNMALCHAAKREFKEALPLLENAKALNTQVKNAYGLAENEYKIGDIAFNQGDYKQAMEHYQSAGDNYKQAADKTGIAKSLFGLGNAYSRQSEPQKSIGFLRQSLALYISIGGDNREGLSINYNSLGNNYFNLSEFDSALYYYNLALALNRSMNNRNLISSNLNNMGTAYRLLSNYPKSIECLEECIAIRKELGNKAGVGSALTNIGTAYAASGNNDKALQCYEQALEINKATGNKPAMAAGFVNLSSLYMTRADYNKALEYDAQALKLYNEMGDRNGQGTIYQHFGSIHTSLGNYSLAIEHYQQALAINQAIGNKFDESDNLSDIGSVYHEINEYDKALDNFSKALEIKKSIEDKDGVATAYAHIGEAWGGKGDANKALYYLEKALVIDRETGNRSNEAIHLSNIASAYSNLDKYSEAKNYYLQSLALAESTKEKYVQASDHIGLGTVYIAENNLKAALQHSFTGLDMARETGQLLNEKYALQNLSLAYEKAGRYDSAYAYHVQYIAVSDSLVNQDIRKQITRKEMQFAFDKKERDYQLQQKIDAANLQSQQQALVINSQELVLGKNQLALSNKEKDLERLNYLKEKAEKQQKELAIVNMQSEFGLKELMNKAEREKMEAAANKRTEAERTRKNYMMVALAFLLLFGTSAWVIISQKRKAGFRSIVSETEMRALRAQMNPHFIFNALNSVYSYIDMNDKKAAKDYLMNFSQLTRLVLENSMQHSVTLEDELKALELYLTLESERLNNRFKFSIEVAAEIDAENTMIPPLLLQPFVENSIWHGMKDEAKSGKIEISVTQSGRNLICVVQDNGSGRRRIEGNQPVLKKGRKSVGMSLTQQRIDIINKRNNSNATVSVQDLTDKDNRPAGVRVELVLPLELGS
jgi:tetratricopeptide (TPR) repeat protein